MPEKHLELLFHSFVLLTQWDKREYRLLIAGDRIERARWEAFCQKNVPGKVTFFGHIADPIRLAELLANSDAFVHPNPREPFGIAPLQAMASALPLVAPNQGGITTYANSENAWLVPANPESFVSAIQDLVANDSLRFRRAQSALQTAEHFHWQRAAASFLELYAELCALRANQADGVLIPNFSSANAKGWELAWSRKISHTTERIFQFVAAQLDRSQRFLRAPDDLFGATAEKSMPEKPVRGSRFPLERPLGSSEYQHGVIGMRK